MPPTDGTIASRAVRPASGQSADQRRGSTLRRYGLAIAKVAVGLLLVWLVLRNIDIQAVGKILARSRLDLFLLATALLTLGVAINAVRWSFVMTSIGHPIGITLAMAANFEAMLFNQLLPTGSGGDAVRMLRSYGAGVTPGWSIIGVLIDKALGLWFVALSVCVVG